MNGFQNSTKQEGTEKYRELCQSKTHIQKVVESNPKSVETA